MTPDSRDRRTPVVRWHRVVAGGVLMFSLAEPAWAYLDPSTGWMILQGLIATLAAAGVAVGTYWHRLKGWFSPHKKTQGNAVVEPSSTEKS